MSRRSRTADPEELRQRLVTLLVALPEKVRIGSVHEQVSALVEVQHYLRDLGASIGASLAPEDSDSGRARVLAYLRSQVGRIVHTDELMIVAGIGDYPRRIRELRTKFGWPIISGMAVRDLRADARSNRRHVEQIPGNMAPDEYLLIEDVPDPTAVARWQNAGRLQTKDGQTKSALLKYFLQAPGSRVTAEELRYVANNHGGWPASVRSLVEDGWQIATHNPRKNAIPFGIFILESTARA